MSRVVLSGARVRYFKPLPEFTEAHLKRWKRNYRRYAYWREWELEQPRDEILEQKRNNAKYYREENLFRATLRYNLRVHRKQERYESRIKLGWPASPVRLKPMPHKVKTYRCASKTCKDPAHRIVQGLNLCEKHLAAIKEHLGVS